MDTRNTKRSDQKSGSRESNNKPYWIGWKGSFPTKKMPPPRFDYMAEKEEELRRRGKREGETRYVSLPDEHGKYGRMGLSFLIYNIDESSDDELNAKMAKKPIGADHIRVKSEEVKRYDGFEEGLLIEGKRLAKTIKISSTGKCIRRIYDLDEASSDEEQPTVKDENKIEKKDKKRKVTDIDETVSIENPSSKSNRLKSQSPQPGIIHKNQKASVDETKTPQADQTQISSSEEHEIDDNTKYGTIGWEGYVPPSKPAVSGELPYANSKFTTFSASQPIRKPNKPNNNSEPQIQNKN